MQTFVLRKLLFNLFTYIILKSFGFFPFEIQPHKDSCRSLWEWVGFLFQILVQYDVKRIDHHKYEINILEKE